jgi:hypothetical protein
MSDLSTAFKSGATQTIFDVALHQYGGLAGLAWLLEDNPGLILENGTVEQFRVAHLVRPAAFANRQLKAAMMRLKPASEGPKGGSEAWITDDGQDWITDDGVAWWT